MNLNGKIFPILFQALGQLDVEGDAGILQTLIGLRGQGIAPHVDVLQWVGRDYVIFDFCKSSIERKGFD